ncbi:hypothetical protein COJ38_21880 [Bacillus cereus]|uniref:hypothetical protein n=1 Tax=Bacillus cereus group TaxID=86661 RepID=UPI000BEC05AD|nr:MULTISPECIES: hypothetical protein [Bacillus cereus group]MEB9862143.1 hypothetical protein [Bacillus cereus]PEB69600.1 hypothetical protein COM91_12475 [Bacillus thuringiensis]PFC05203.1 hypothetical protein CN280_16755 [Bacillus cereus]PFL86171.1 hypothetical protein COJ38_21880 [Bacillus cereus]PFN79000.1 hypothetical protein COJ64_04270 [Bacillus cereus]
MSLQESKTFEQNIDIGRHHRLEGAELDGAIAEQCRNSAIQKVNGWNDGPQGKLYDFVDIHMISNKNAHTETKHDPWTGKNSWDYTSLASYTIMYNDTSK